ncbi:MAG: carboxypeptidase-like regulatory domain-containing protein, partial [Prevotellaceae bacterium]|nr:carboxypeptidase-like regulatory domain-containing protein [Prevotellaceae bacterium]
MDIKTLNKNHSKYLRKMIFSAVIFLAGTCGLLAQHTVTGSVSDSEGTLSGANVVVKGTNVGALTGADGTYSINVPDNNATLLFSLMGYASQEVAVGSRTVVDVTLAEEAELIDEVVVVAYGV